MPDLPDDVLLSIYTHLPIEDLLAIRTVRRTTPFHPSSIFGKPPDLTSE